jgi:hypothetical protein
MGKAAPNEVRKLKAGWYNALSTAVVSVGLLGPVVKRIFGALSTPVDASLSMIVPLVCLGASRALHMAARYQLKELED